MVTYCAVIEFSEALKNIQCDATQEWLYCGDFLVSLLDPPCAMESKQSAVFHFDPSESVIILKKYTDFPLLPLPVIRHHSQIYLSAALTFISVHVTGSYSGEARFLRNN